MDFLLELLSLLVFVYVIISFFPELRDQPWARELNKVMEMVLKPIRDILPKDMPLDPSPMILIMLIQMLKMLF
jgi:uncharacterized protein YggT (Ycf19 family)